MFRRATLLNHARWRRRVNAEVERISVTLQTQSSAYGSHSWVAMCPPIFNKLFDGILRTNVRNYTLPDVFYVFGLSLRWSITCAM